MIRTTTPFLAAVGALALTVTPAFAQDRDPEPDQATSERAQQERRPTPRSADEVPDNALDLDESDPGGFVIVGKEHLPDFTVLINRENLSKAYDLELEEAFLPKIIEAIGEEPF